MSRALICTGSQSTIEVGQEASIQQRVMWKFSERHVADIKQTLPLVTANNVVPSTMEATNALASAVSNMESTEC